MTWRINLKERKGIILAGGTGSRLYPLTIGISKQLLPVYDKPMIYYPISVLMLAGIKNILVITTPEDKEQFKRVLGDGRKWGINIDFEVQRNPDGLAQAFILAENFLDNAPAVLVLGDNIFFGHDLAKILRKANLQNHGATIFGYHVDNPNKYGVLGFDSSGNVNSIIEKPKVAASNYVVTGIYFVDETACDRAKQVKPSHRGELEITAVLNSYLQDHTLTVERLGRGFAWLDTGTHSSLLDAGNFVHSLTERQGLQLGSPDEIAFNLGWISREQLIETANYFEKK